MAGCGVWRCAFERAVRAGEDRDGAGKAKEEIRDGFYQVVCVRQAVTTTRESPSPARTLPPGSLGWGEDGTRSLRDSGRNSCRIVHYLLLTTHTSNVAWLPQLWCDDRASLVGMDDLVATP